VVLHPSQQAQHLEPLLAFHWPVWALSQAQLQALALLGWQ
jgi:hypothetical protein